MSLILDALRKSEAERRRGQSPDLFASLPTASTTPRPTMLRMWPVFAISMLVLAALFAFWMTRQDIAPIVTEAAPTGTQEVDAISLPQTGKAMEPAPIAVHPPPGPTATTHAAAAPPPRPPTVQSAPPAVASAASAAAAATPPASASSTPAAASAPTSTADSDAESLPPIAVLDAGERAALPPLKLSMHVWDSDPAKRFAIIDGQRVREGSVVGNSVIAQIRHDGVVLDINGRRILLPRP